MPCVTLPDGNGWVVSVPPTSVGSYSLQSRLLHAAGLAPLAQSFTVPMVLGSASLGFSPFESIRAGLLATIVLIATTTSNSPTFRSSSSLTEL